MRLSILAVVTLSILPACSAQSNPQNAGVASIVLRSEDTFRYLAQHPVTQADIQALGQKTFSELYRESLARVSNAVVQLDDVRFSHAHDRLASQAAAFSAYSIKYANLRAFWLDNGISARPVAPTLASVQLTFSAMGHFVNQNSGVKTNTKLALTNGGEPASCDSDSTVRQNTNGTPMTTNDGQKAYNDCIDSYSRGGFANSESIQGICSGLAVYDTCQTNQVSAKTNPPQLDPSYPYCKDGTAEVESGYGFDPSSGGPHGGSCRIKNYPGNPQVQGAPYF